MERIDPTVPTIKAVVIMDSEGKRIAVKYFSEGWEHSVPAQAEFEKNLFAKTSRTNARGEAEIIVYDDVLVVYKFIADLMFFVVSDPEENEIVLSQALTGLCDAVNLLLRGAVEKKSCLENLDLVLLSMDELVDGGLILETDGTVLASRAAMRTGDAEGMMGSPIAMDLHNPGLQTLQAAFGNVREQLARSLLK